MAQILHIGNVARGYIPAIVDPVDGVTAKNADSINYIVRRNGVDVTDTVNITFVNTGLYEWNYNPSSEIEGEQISIRFTIILTGSDSIQRTVYYTVDIIVVVNNLYNFMTDTSAALTDIQTSINNLYNIQIDQKSIFVDNPNDSLIPILLESYRVFTISNGSLIEIT